MSGLFQRALHIKERGRPRLTLEKRDLSEEAGSLVSPEEQVEVMHEINTIAEENRLKIGRDTFAYTPRRRGLFPLWVNIIGAAVIAVSVAVMLLAFNTSENRIIAARSAGRGVEAAYLEELKRETEKQLADKDREISGIRKAIGSLAGERDALLRGMDEAVSRKEAELAASLEAALNQERDRLAAAGLGAAALAGRVKELEDELETKRARELLEFKQQTDREIKAVTGRFEKMIAARNEALAVSVAERGRYEDESRRRETALREQYEVKLAESDRARAASSSQLEALRRENEREELVTSQILAAWTRVRTDLEARRYAAAAASLDSLEKYLAEKSVAALPGVSRRTSIDLFVIRALGELIASRGAAPAADEKTAAAADAALLARAETLAELSRTAAKADALSRAGRAAEAQAEYAKAIGLIPEVKKTYTALRQMDRAALEREAEKAALEKISGFDEPGYQDALAKAEAAARAEAAAKNELASIKADLAVKTKALARAEAGIEEAAVSVREAEAAAREAEAAKKAEAAAREELAAAKAEFAAARKMAEAETDTTAAVSEAAYGEALAKAEAAAKRADDAAAGEKQARLDADAARKDLTEAKNEAADIRTELAGLRKELADAKDDLARLASEKIAADKAAAKKEAEHREALAKAGAAAALAAEAADAKAAGQENEIARLEKELAAQTALARDLAARAEKTGLTADNLNKLIADFTDYTRQNKVKAGLSDQKLTELMEAKLRVREILSAEPIRSQYPTLYQALEEYFTSFEEEYWQAGHIAALQGLTRLFELVKKGGDKKAVSGVLAEYANQTQRDSLSRLFAAMRAGLE